jgi:hypothetical protein
MPEPFFNKDLISFAEIATRLKVHPETVRRWRNPGRRGFRLRAWKVGQTYFSTEEEIEKFAAALGESAKEKPCKTNMDTRL